MKRFLLPVVYYFACVLGMVLMANVHRPDLISTWSGIACSVKCSIGLILLAGHAYLYNVSNREVFYFGLCYGLLTGVALYMIEWEFLRSEFFLGADGDYHKNLCHHPIELATFIAPGVLTFALLAANLIGQGIVSSGPAGNEELTESSGKLELHHLLAAFVPGFIGIGLVAVFVFATYLITVTISRFTHEKPEMFSYDRDLLSCETGMIARCFIVSVVVWSIAALVRMWKNVPVVQESDRATKDWSRR